MKFGEAIQSADWKKEKHVPVIEAPSSAKAGEAFKVTVSVGKEIPHPNTPTHYIAWIDVYFKPQDEKFLYQVAHFDFTGHGAGPVCTDPQATFAMTVEKPGTIVAVASCNIHGLWESSSALELEA
ncbi:MAG TPA: Neelaredoxin [Chloroflexi bacterium]|nr:Neelaredoxin [Chloroflexota bacterium]